MQPTGLLDVGNQPGHMIRALATTLKLRSFTRRSLPVTCLILFHSSDGSPIWIKSAAVTVIKPAHQDHLAKGTQSVVFTVTGKTFAVREKDEEVVAKIDACDRP
jgi:hypothetical protein